LTVNSKSYPWREHVRCSCGRGYVVDYTQDRDWSRCPICTGEAGRPARRVFDPVTRTWRVPDAAR
jgi:hypothetical protein